MLAHLRRCCALVPGLTQRLWQRLPKTKRYLGCSPICTIRVLSTSNKRPHGAPMNMRIRKYNWHSAPPQIRGIRQRVFVEEQKVPEELEWDLIDQSAEHFLVVVDGNIAAATARLYGIPGATGFIGRMAVLPQFRGQQIGQALLQHLICQGAAHYSQLQLSAQQHAVEFYQRAGFHLCSDQYDDAGIAHFDMRCLAPSVLAEELAAEPAEKRPDIRKFPMNLGDDSRSWLFERQQQLVELMHSLAGQA